MSIIIIIISMLIVQVSAPFIFGCIWRILASASLMYTGMSFPGVSVFCFFGSSCVMMCSSSFFGLFPLLRLVGDVGVLASCVVYVVNPVTVAVSIPPV